ncbi:MAG: hypothetical protein DCC67_16995 [Planctomycetota bacterium]|nr:MAG: hypothetical protein DCC67_16995 [Planctomycetota bacterium]
MIAKLSAVAVGLGALLLVGSAAWGFLFPPTRTWTNEKSERLTQLGSETNRLKFELIQAKQSPKMHGGKNPAEIQQQYDKARAEWEALHEEFASSRDTPKTASRILRWSGIAFVLAGGLAVFATRSA